MASLNDRLRALEAPGGDYPERCIAEALRRLPTERLETYVAAMECALEQGAASASSTAAVNHILALCKEIKKEGVL